MRLGQTSMFSQNLPISHLSLSFRPMVLSVYRYWNIFEEGSHVGPIIPMPTVQPWARELPELDTADNLVPGRRM